MPGRDVDHQAANDSAGRIYVGDGAASAREVALAPVGMAYFRNWTRREVLPLTATGRKQLQAEKEGWTRLAEAITLILQEVEQRYGSISNNKAESDLHKEIEFHIEERERSLIEQSVPVEEVYRQARLEFGAIQGIKEKCREAGPFSGLEILVKNVRYALRSLVRVPVFTVAALRCGKRISFGPRAFVSGEFFEVLGVDALLGRMFMVSDDRPGCGTSAPDRRARLLLWLGERPGFRRWFNILLGVGD